MTQQNVDYDSLAGNIIDEINRLRANPKEYVKELEAWKGQYTDENRVKRENGRTLATKEGKKAVDEAIAVLNTTPSLGQLKNSQGLSKAALDHLHDLGPKGGVSHTGSDGSDVQARIERYGTIGDDGGMWSENIGFGMETAREVVLQQIIDDGVSTRGHRKNLLNEKINAVGVACGPHAKYEIMSVLDFASNYTENS